jgi:probable selenium-dependent hydroxylase accessory protein YqeC
MTPLLDCLAIDLRTRVIALVGAGGKTSLLYALAREMVERGRSVVTTTTTKIYPPKPDESPHLLLLEHDPHLASLPAYLAKFSHVTVADRTDTVTGKLRGVTDDAIDTCTAAAQWIVVEADGAAGHPVKAPAAWEPVLPTRTDLVIVVVGLDCLGRPAREDSVFRLPEFCKVTGLAEGEAVTPEALARLVTHPQGGMKEVREGVRVIPFLTKIDLVSSTMPEKTARSIVRASAGRIHLVAAGTLRPLVQMITYS